MQIRSGEKEKCIIMFNAKWQLKYMQKKKEKKFLLQKLLTPGPFQGLYSTQKFDHSKLAPPSSTPWRMDDKWSENSFLLGSNSVANNDG